MLNPQAVAHQSVEIIDGSISEYYEMVDSALRPSEVCPAKYNTTTSPSYQNQCPCVQGSFTTVDIGCADPNVVLMEKSFIAPTVSFDITSSVNITTESVKYNENPSVFFVGWKRSMDVFYKYSILYNGSEVFDQTYNGEESFVIQTIMKDDVREKRPNQLTSYRNASSLNRDVCGTYVLFRKDKQTAHVAIPVKITLADFPFFTQFNYLMGWMGNWSIRMYPDSRNIVTCQVNPEYTIGKKKEITSKYTALGQIGTYEHGFVQIGDEFVGISGWDEAQKTHTLSMIKFTVSNYQFDACDINLTQQVMWRPYYEQIMAKYMQKPLMIPFLTFIFGRFSQQMTKNNGMHSVFSGVIKCCEAMFVIPFVDDNHHTVCKNPKFGSLYANVGAYGNYPQNPIDTYCKGDNERSFLRFINMTNDALGLEYSPLISMNEDLSNSLHAAIHKIYIAGDAAPAEIKYDNSDATNFLIGFPFADEADFQGGLTTGGNINIQIHAGTSKFDDIMPLSQSLSIGPTAIFMCDHVVMIQPAPSGLPALVKIETNKVN